VTLRMPRAGAYAALGLYAFSLLSIGLTEDWRLRHEDNGALHTTLALSHQPAGTDVDCSQHVVCPLSEVRRMTAQAMLWNETAESEKGQ
jgi:hypothetical protein